MVMSLSQQNTIQKLRVIKRLSYRFQYYLVDEFNL